MKNFISLACIREHILSTITVKNSVISPTFLVWNFCGKGQFPYSFGLDEITVLLAMLLQIIKAFCVNLGKFP